jgi:RHH-type proline utilization regulon transcriptional repressor/proline dehydrogenase/delta 1-pyrroline-5-carboxylate dehydrogenase
MLKGAMDLAVIGDPAEPTTDIGPLIDDAARRRIEHYLAALPPDARVLHHVTLPPASCPTPNIGPVPERGYSRTSGVQWQWRDR